MNRARTVPLLLSAPAFLIYAFFLAVPIAAVVLISFTHPDLSAQTDAGLTASSYRELLTEPYYYEIYARTFGVGLLVTAACTLIGTAEAIIVYRMASPWRGLFLMLVLGPLLVSVVVRTLGWALFFGSTGLLSQALMLLGLAAGPVDLMYTNLGVGIALVHVLVPFVVIAVWGSLLKVKPASEAAALSLGASQWTAVRRVVLPQIYPGIFSGAIIVFAMSVSAFATPALIGGRRLQTVATAAYDEFLNTLNWPLGAALATVLLVSTSSVLWAANRLIERRFGALGGEADI